MTDAFSTPSTLPPEQRTTPHHSFPLPVRARTFEPDRDRFGRYVLPNPVTGKVENGTRTTTLADSVDDKFNVHRWEVRSVVQGLKANPDLLEDIDSLADTAELNKDLDRVIDRAKVEAGTAYGSELGTAVHEWCEVVDGGHATVADVPDVFRPKVARYVEVLAAAGISTLPGGIEQITRNVHREVTGTFDRIYVLPDGTYAIGDIKTGKDLGFSYGAISAQLAAYADAEYVLSADGKSWLPMPVVRSDYAVVAWIPSNQDAHVELVTIDLEYGRRVLDAAQEVRRIRQSARTSVAGKHALPAYSAPVAVEAPVGPTSAPTDLAPNGQPLWAYEELCARIDAAADQATLAQLWQDHAHVWTDELTARGQETLARAAAAAQAAAAAVSNPFAPAAF